MKVDIDPDPDLDQAVIFYVLNTYLSQQLLKLCLRFLS